MGLRIAKEARFLLREGLGFATERREMQRRTRGNLAKTAILAKASFEWGCVESVRVGFRKTPMNTVLRIAMILAGLGVLERDSRAAIVVHPPFQADYSVHVLGSVPGLPPKYGGLTFLAGNPSVLVIGGDANDLPGRLYSVGVVRGGDQHITGFSGAAAFFAEAPNNDGGVVYGPGGVLFLARWPVNELGQIKPGSTATDKVIGLGQFEVAASPGGLMFVPPGYPGAGQLKLVSWSGGQFYTIGLAADGQGTYNVTGAKHETSLVNGPEGLLYAPPGSPQLVDYRAMLVCEYSAGSVGVYQIDDQGNPIAESRVDFISGLAGAEGAALDPLTGDFLFSTFGGGDQVIVVRGLAAPPSADLVMGKKASANAVGAGGELVFTLSVTNLGSARATDVQVTDEVPAQFGILGIVPSQGTYGRQGNRVTVNLGNLSAGASAAVSIRVLANEIGAWTNVATVAGTEADPVSSNNAAAASGNVTSEAMLGIAMYAGLNVTGTVGWTYRIEYKENLLPTVPWTYLTNIVLSQSPYLWIDVGSTNAPRRFYQAVWAPDP